VRLSITAALLPLALIGSVLVLNPQAEAASCRKSCDTAAPTVSISAPSAGATVAGNVAVTGTAADDVGLARVEVQVDAGTWQTVTGTTSWSWTWSTTGAADGTHTLTARSTDRTGKTATASRAVSVQNPTADTTAPTVTVSSPASGATVSGVAQVLGSAADNTAVAKVEVALDGNAWQAATGTSSWSWAWDSRQVADGAHTLTARSTDAAGNISTVTRSVQVSNADTTAPSVSFSSPASGATVTGTVNVTGVAADNTALAKVEVQVDAGAWQAATGTSTWSWSWSTGQATNATHTLTVRATDTAGNTATAARPVTVANSVSAGTCAATGAAPNSSVVLPEGTKIRICTTAGNWSAGAIADMLRANAAGPGDFATIAPTLTVEVQDKYASQTAVAATSSGGVYVKTTETMYLNATSGSGFAVTPDAVLSHEYGHVWSLYYLYLARQNNYGPWLSTRWDNADGSLTLGQDSRLDSSGTWARAEIMADDYRLLFGTAAAVEQRPSHLNTMIPDPRNQPGLRDWLLAVWRAS